jgi:hypothetical protein
MAVGEMPARGVIPMLSDMKQQLSEFDDRAEKLGRRL